MEKKILMPQKFQPMGPAHQQLTQEPLQNQPHLAMDHQGIQIDIYI